MDGERTNGEIAVMDTSRRTKKSTTDGFPSLYMTEVYVDKWNLLTPCASQRQPHNEVAETDRKLICFQKDSLNDNMSSATQHVALQAQAGTGPGIYLPLHVIQLEIGWCGILLRSQQGELAFLPAILRDQQPSNIQEDTVDAGENQ